jgi:hypothetical protein
VDLCEPVKAVIKFINIFLALSGFAALMMICIGGLMMTTTIPSQIDKAKGLIIRVLIGLVIVILGLVIVKTLASIFGQVGTGC